MRWFTREAALWCAVALMAALPRLLHLNVPLVNSEAAVALTSFSAARGGSVVFANPLFGALQTFVFAVFGANDVTARLISALSGVMLCLLPVLLRQQLGRGRALALGGLLALSPTLWFVSRQADGEMLAWVLAFAVFCAWRASRHVFAGTSLGLLLACGVDAVSPLIVVIAASVVAGQPSLRALSPRLAFAAVVAFIIGATGALLHVSGLGDAFNGYALWLQSLHAEPVLSPVRLGLGFLANEPLVVIGAIAGIVLLTIGRGFNRAEVAWLAWLGAGVALMVVLPSRDASALTPIVIGSSALAAFAYERLAVGLLRHWIWQREGVITGASFVLLLYAGLGVWQYAGQGQSAWLYPVLIALLLILAILAAGSLGLDTGATVRGTALAFTASMLLYAFGAGLRMNHVNTANSAEPYRVEAPSDGLNTLVRVIRETSLRTSGEPNVLGVQVDETASAALRWALRDMQGLRYSMQPSTLSAALTPEKAKPPTNGNFIGQAYELSTKTALDAVGCQPQPQGGTNCQPLARWMAFREAGVPSEDKWVLWLRDDLAAKASGLR